MASPTTRSVVPDKQPAEALAECLNQTARLAQTAFKANGAEVSVVNDGGAAWRIGKTRSASAPASRVWIRPGNPRRIFHHCFIAQSACVNESGVHGIWGGFISARLFIRQRGSRRRFGPVIRADATGVLFASVMADEGL